MCKRRSIFKRSFIFPLNPGGNSTSIDAETRITLHDGNGQACFLGFSNNVPAESRESCKDMLIFLIKLMDLRYIEMVRRLELVNVEEMEEDLVE
jgi:hypothetical protein